MGHHSGLMNIGNKKTDTADDHTFFGRLTKGKCGGIPDYKQNWPGGIQTRNEKKRSMSLIEASFYIRMLYSCLVDADFIDTESFMNGGSVERGKYETMESLHDKLEQYTSKWRNPTRELDKLRTEILSACEEAGEGERGVYTLTVPTGGGKTIASMAFALRHAIKNAMRRIIYVIPYTSIIDQNAAIFREILGSENVVEHHSSIAYDSKEQMTEEEYRKIMRKALAIENWDAPVIVTTSVQFFESLYSNRSSKCRKLHNIANSVIIFDEAQMIPLRSLRPCVAAIAELVKNFKSTAVLCTATQPALDDKIKEFYRECKIVEICPKIDYMFDKFQRTKFCFVGKITDSELSELITRETQVLCIANTRKQAQTIFNSLPEEGSFHLSTLMYPVHRKSVLSSIRERLKNGETCRVISTSLIEAGVDVDFPKVFREISGLDSILQAAGRCNREGKRKTDESIVTVFETNRTRNKLIGANIGATCEAVRDWSNPNTVKTIEDYFKAYRSLNSTEDVADIIGQLNDKGFMLPFENVARDFKIIDNAMMTVYVPHRGGRKIIEELRIGTNLSKSLLREAGQYSVSVYENHFKQLVKHGHVELLADCDDAAILCNMELYSEKIGLKSDVSVGPLALFD